METQLERLTTDLQASREREEDFRTLCACRHGLQAAQGRFLSGWNADVAFGGSSMKQQRICTECDVGDLHQILLQLPNCH